MHYDPQARIGHTQVVCLAKPRNTPDRLHGVAVAERDRRGRLRVGRRRRGTRRRLFRRGASGDEHGKAQESVVKRRVAPRAARRPYRNQLLPFIDSSRRHQELPAPCVSVVQRSNSMLSQVSVCPSGQCTSTAGRASESPNPTTIRGSLAEA